MGFTAFYQSVWTIWLIIETATYILNQHVCSPFGRADSMRLSRSGCSTGHTLKRCSRELESGNKAVDAMTHAAILDAN